MPSNNFQFRIGANLSYFIVGEKHLKFPLGKKLILIVEPYLLLNQNQQSFLSQYKHLVECF